jgi:UDP-N-acetylmuramate dehydrogenase
MNAGYTKPISNIIKSVTVLRDFEVVKLNRNELSFGHRTSPFQYNSDVILSAELQLVPGDIRETVKAYVKDRKKKQPLHHPNCGSVFKKPGKKVKNLDGISVGGAEYCKGFILNTGGATAKDVLDVIDLVQKKAKKKLVLEAELMGDF